MPTTTPSLIRLRRTALACLLLVLAVTTLSAGLRLAHGGPGCEAWPACYGAHLRGESVELANQTMLVLARMLHRLSAMLVLVLALILCAAAWTLHRWRELRLAVGIVVVALGLAVLGRYSAGATLPAIALGNVLGGYTLLALAFAIWRGSGTGARRSRPAVALLILLIVQIALGVLVSAGYAGLSCTGFPGCGEGSIATWSLLDPMRTPAFAPTPPIHPVGAFTHLLHRGLALLVLVAALATGIAAWRGGRRRAATVLIGLIVLQLALGLTLVFAALPYAAALLHNLVSALLLLATLACMRVAHPSSH